MLNAVGLYILFFVGAHAQELAEQYHKIKEKKIANFKNGGLSKLEKNGDISNEIKENNMAKFQDGGLSKIEENGANNRQESNGVTENRSNGAKYSGLKRICEKTD